MAKQAQKISVSTAPVQEQTPVVDETKPLAEGQETQTTVQETPVIETPEVQNDGAQTQSEPQPEIQAQGSAETGATPEAPQPEQPPVVLEQPVVVTPPVEKQEEVAPAIVESLTLRNIRQELEDYSEKMGRTVPHTMETASHFQHRLYQTYSKIFTLEPVEFKVAMDLVISYFKENVTGAFGEARVFRAAEMLALAKTSQRMFFHMTQLFVKAGEVGAAAAGRESDLKALAQSLPTEQARQWLLQYFR